MNCHSVEIWLVVSSEHHYTIIIIYNIDGKIILSGVCAALENTIIIPCMQVQLYNNVFPANFKLL